MDYSNWDRLRAESVQIYGDTKCDKAYFVARSLDKHNSCFHEIVGREHTSVTLSVPLPDSNKKQLAYLSSCQAHVSTANPIKPVYDCINYEVDSRLCFLGGAFQDVVKVFSKKGRNFLGDHLFSVVREIFAAPIVSISLQLDTMFSNCSLDSASVAVSACSIFERVLSFPSSIPSCSGAWPTKF